MQSGNTVATTSPQARPGGLVGCTVIYREQLPNARVLADSFHRFHSEAAFVVLLVDGKADQETLPNTELLFLADLGLGEGEEWRLPMLMGHGDLRTYLEPVLIELLSRRYGGPVAYFSETTQIFRELTDVFEMVRTSRAIVATEPIQNEWGDAGRSFIGVPPGSVDLGEWLKLSRDAARGESSLRSLFGTVPHRLIKDPAFAIHYSNLDPTSLSRVAQGFEIGDQPLLSFDFRGYDPDKPHLLSRYLGVQPRILLSQFPMVAALCDDYRKQLVEAGYSPNSAQLKAFEFLPSGLHLDARMLRAYREALADFLSGSTAEPPSPFGPSGEDGFLNWLNEPCDRAGIGVSRYMLAVYEDRPDVQAAFPDPINRDAAAFRHWYFTFGAQELNLPAALVPLKRAATVSGPTPVNVGGYFRAELGIGAAARSLVTALEAADIPINTITFDRTANRLAHPFTDRSTSGGSADINIVCINPDQISVFAEQAGPEFSHGRYSIGVWFWEVEDFPLPLHHAFNYVDEIWVASDFVRQVFLKVSPKPVFKFPLPVLAPTIDRSLTRAQLHLPEQFIFLFSFDFLSVLERKNPVDLIRAFTRAFAPGEGPRLVIKTINGDKRTLEMEKLKYAIGDRPDIVLMDGYRGAIENATITASCDCYVSLHRSEGFGLTMAEAMALGKPTIATAYSGNLEFMTPENSYLCPALRVEVGPEREPYPADSYWSQPDIAAAAGLLQTVYARQDEARERGRRAAEDIRSFHSPAITGKVVSERLALIRRRRARKGPVRSADFLQDQIDELEERVRQSESNV